MSRKNRVALIPLGNSYHLEKANEIAFAFSSLALQLYKTAFDVALYSGYGGRDSLVVCIMGQDFSELGSPHKEKGRPFRRPGKSDGVG